MSILENIDLRLKSALKEKDEEVLSSLRMIKSTLKNKEIEKKEALNDEEVTDVLYSEIKKRKESSALYEKANRPDLAKKENSEAEIISLFLPEQLSGTELSLIVSSAISEVGATSMADMGKIMAQVMPKVKGKASGTDVSKKVSEILNK